MTQELLARMGVPLQQCKQAYQYMTPALRSHFAQQMADQNILDTYNFTNPGVTFKVQCAPPNIYSIAEVACKYFLCPTVAPTNKKGICKYSGMGFCSLL